MNRLAAMEAFVRVVDSGSFSSAARQLKLGQPAVSKMIAQLEERLGVCLLLRSTHGLTATEAGQRFYDRAKRALEEADEADIAARGAGASMSGRLRVSAAVTFARLHVVPLLPAFLEEYPELDIEVVLDDRNINLIDEGVDIALRMGDLGDSALKARRIGQARRLVVGSPTYLASAGIPKSPTDLSAHQTVIYDRSGGGTHWKFCRGSEESTVTLHGRVRLTAAEGVREAVFAGLGLAIASEWMFKPELNSGVVTEVLSDWVLPTIDLWAAFPAGRQSSAKARVFASFVESQINLSSHGS